MGDLIGGNLYNLPLEFSFRIESGICERNLAQQDVLFNYPLVGDNSESSQKQRREIVVEESDELYDDEQKENRLEYNNFMRMKRDKQTIELPKGYSIYNVPKLNDETPLSVFVFINISKILDWDELNENIKLDMRFKLMWRDFGISKFYNNTATTAEVAAPLIDTLTREDIKLKRKTNSNPDLFKSVWKPNLFIEGLLVVDQPVLMAKPLTIRFIPELGWFEYNTRIQVQIDCSMDFRYYPADTQECFLSVREYSFTKFHVKLTWHKRGVYLNDLLLSNFDVWIDDVNEFELAKSEDPDEIYNVLRCKIIARRKLSYHLIQTYMASSFYIIITTLCFLLPSNMVEVRIGMAMTTLLTLTAMFGSIRESTPIVSYIKAIDIWMVGCIGFVFLTLFQFTFSTWLKHARWSKLMLNRKSKGIHNDAYEIDEPSKMQATELALEFDSIPIGPVFSDKTIEIIEKVNNFLEIYSFPMFLTIFVFYTTGYWIWLFSSSKYFDMNVNATWNRL